MPEKRAPAKEEQKEPAISRTAGSGNKELEDYK